MPQRAARRATPRQAAIGLAVVALAVAAGPLFIVLSSGRGGQPLVPSSAPVSARPSTPPTPTPTPAPPSVVWTDVAASYLKGIDFVGAAQAGDTLVVAGNTVDAGDGATTPIIAYYSGSAWQTVDDRAVFADSRVDWLVGVPGGLVAIGESTLPDPACPAGSDDSVCVSVAAPVVWTSSDGRSWSRLGSDAMAPLARVWVTAAASGPSGLAAYGVRIPASYASGAVDEAVALSSTDGRSWSPATPSGGGAGVAWPQRLAEAKGGLVATGAAGAVWTSPDGAAWSPAAVPAGALESWPARDIAVARGGLLDASQGWMAQASGSPGFDLGPLWRSVDGSSWAAAEWPTGGTPLVFAGDGSRVGATGPDGSGIWWSADGAAWTEGTASGTAPTADALAPAAPGVWLTKSWIVVGGASCLFVGAISG